MMTNSPKQLNAFEIKSEISRIIKALEHSNILVDITEFKTFDEQTDKTLLYKILMKEFARCNEDNLPVIKLLLLRYQEENVLIHDMEEIIKNPKNTNKIKLHAIEIISSINPNWHEENYDSYLEYDEELIQKETQELLENSEENPEIQLDFLDFFCSIGKEDQMLLLDSLQEDQAGGDLANILVPIFLSYPKEEIGNYALKMLKNTKSTFAYKALSEVIDLFDLNTQVNIKKVLNELKLAGAAKDNTKQTQQNEEFYIIPPDGEGNTSLIYKRINPDNNVTIVGIIIDDYEGINECLGFNSISEFEAGFLIDKLSGTDFKTQITPEFFKKLLLTGEKLSYKNSAPPYEYNCWKRIFINLPQKEFNYEGELAEITKNYKPTAEDIRDLLESNFLASWYYSPDFGDETEIFFKKLDDLLINKGFIKEEFEEIFKFGLNTIFYLEECEHWQKRIVLSAYCKLLAKDNVSAKTLYQITQDNDLMRELYKFILKQSVFQYFLNIQVDKNLTKYTNEEIDEILGELTKLWGFYV